MSTYNSNCYPKTKKFSDASLSEKLTVLDVCNNELIFIKKADNSVTFEYKPMTPNRSCSGRYDGGTPVFRHLEPSEWAKLMTTYHSAKTEGKVCKDRYKGTSVFKYQSGTISDSVILTLDPSTDKLTNFFHSYRK